MTNMSGFNARREERTEERIAKVEKILSHRSLLRDELLERLGLGETTASHVIQAAMRQGRIRYERGRYHKNG